MHTSLPLIQLPGYADRKGPARRRTYRHAHPATRKGR